jgi:hypothetical protein
MRTKGAPHDLALARWVDAYVARDPETEAADLAWQVLNGHAGAVGYVDDPGGVRLCPYGDGPADRRMACGDELAEHQHQHQDHAARDLMVGRGMRNFWKKARAVRGTITGRRG